jgi:hypothetical protein
MPVKPIRTEPDGLALRLTFICPFCRGESQVTVAENKWRSWSQGKGYVQDVFPELSAGERETLINGSHEACFDKAFG